MIYVKIINHFLNFSPSQLLNFSPARLLQLYKLTNVESPKSPRPMMPMISELDFIFSRIVSLLVMGGLWWLILNSI